MDGSGQVFGHNLDAVWVFYRWFGWLSPVESRSTNYHMVDDFDLR